MIGSQKMALNQIRELMSVPTFTFSLVWQSGEKLGLPFILRLFFTSILCKEDIMPRKKMCPTIRIFCGTCLASYYMILLLRHIYSKLAIL
jgi:hypothetical protein